ncbi:MULTISPECIES: hypothetical protein [Streptomyces]|uniref:hypothetical protein n=1 Tax=Streptomyces TaxID=1883 RepID=UPI00205EB54D|nr:MULTISPECIES: hypothetical protein [Streptomyces]UPT41786.1 hypothetical protein MWG59_10295 [Streptomyces sp. WAC00303]WIY76018.1 hypothetical protein QPM16_10155 [Streptomyces anulatus]
MTEPTLTLFSADLLSKWGFNDGDDPEWWLDWCESQRIDYNAFDFPWAAIVRQHLIPAIEQDVTVVDIETIHNPIRVETVNGTDVSEAWYGRVQEPTLTPDHVDVPVAEVLRLALAEAGLTEPPRTRGATL